MTRGVTRVAGGACKERPREHGSKDCCEWVLHRKVLSIGGWLSFNEEEAKLPVYLLTSLICRSLWFAQPLASTFADARHALSSESVSTSFEVKQMLVQMFLGHN